MPLGLCPLSGEHDDPQQRQVNMSSVIKNYRIADLFLTTLLISVIVAILGYVDYLTGDLSIDLLYLICVILVTWLAGSGVGLVCIAEILTAKIMADYNLDLGLNPLVNWWNHTSSVVINLIVWLLVGQLKKSLFDK